MAASRLHRQIGVHLEAGYGERADDMAAELVVHFERGRDLAKAVHYRQHAAQKAQRRSAHSATAEHAHQGLALLTTLPDTPERAQTELRLLAEVQGNLGQTENALATLTQAPALSR